MENWSGKRGSNSRPSAWEADCFQQLSQAYLDHRVAEGKVRQSYTHIYGIWQTVFGKLTLENISSSDILHWINHYHEKRSWSAQTKLHAINGLSGFFRWAIQQGYATANPCARIPRPKVKNERRFVISKDQLRDILSKLPGWCRDLVVVAAMTGLRFSKLTGLMPSDLRQDEEGDYFLECLDKNGELHRAYLCGQALAICCRRASGGAQWLLSGRNGGQVTQRTMRRHLIPAAKSVGLEWGRSRYGFTFHSLRRAFASHMLNSGVPIERVMAAGNWKSYDAVKRYAIVNNKTKKEDMSKLGELIST